MQCLAALRVQQPYIDQFNRRYQAIGPRNDVADLHFGAQHAGRLLLQPRTHFADSRHNNKMQATPDQNQREPR